MKSLKKTQKGLLKPQKEFLKEDQKNGQIQMKHLKNERQWKLHVLLLRSKAFFYYFLNTLVLACLGHKNCHIY